MSTALGVSLITLGLSTLN